MYFLQLSGTIPENKQTEFEQTFQFVRSKLPEGCSGCIFSRDVDDFHNYHFISYWNKLDNLESFAHSVTSQMILGAFKTLGQLKENKSGLLIEINTR
jgi:hypothetical protein